MAVAGRTRGRTWPGGAVGAGPGRLELGSTGQTGRSAPPRPPARGLPIPRAPRVSAVSIWPAQLLFMQRCMAGVSSADCLVLFLKSHGCGCFCGWVERKSTLSLASGLQAVVLQSCWDESHGWGPPGLDWQLVVGASIEACVYAAGIRGVQMSRLTGKPAQGGAGDPDQPAGAQPDVRGRARGISRLPEPAPRYAGRRGARRTGRGREKPGWSQPSLQEQELAPRRSRALALPASPGPSPSRPLPAPRPPSLSRPLRALWIFASAGSGAGHRTIPHEPAVAVAMSVT